MPNRWALDAVRREAADRAAGEQTGCKLTRDPPVDVSEDPVDNRCGHGQYGDHLEARTDGLAHAEAEHQRYSGTRRKPPPLARRPVNRPTAAVDASADTFASCLLASQETFVEPG